eukprot:Gb_41143 [translate_table: standard]
MSITESKPTSERDISIVNPSVVTGYQDVAGSAMTVVTGFYEAINRKDMNVLSDLIADGCILNDLSFPKAFEGRQFMKDFMDAMGKGMVFVIDGMREGDAFIVGVMWHLGRQVLPGPSVCQCLPFHAGDVRRQPPPSPLQLTPSLSPFSLTGERVWGINEGMSLIYSPSLERVEGIEEGALMAPPPTPSLLVAQGAADG